MAALTKTQLFPLASMGRYERVGQSVEASYSLSAAAGNGDTFDVPFIADYVAVGNKAGVGTTIAKNVPVVGSSRITLASGVTAADLLRVTVKGRP